jgi:hypothetical protein
MLSVRDVSEADWKYISTTASMLINGSRFVNFYIPREISHRTIGFRAASDYLRQGSKISHLRDRAVSNHQLKGDIDIIPREYGGLTIANPNNWITDTNFQSWSGRLGAVYAGRALDSTLHIFPALSSTDVSWIYGSKGPQPFAVRNVIRPVSVVIDGIQRNSFYYVRGDFLNTNSGRGKASYWAPQVSWGVPGSRSYSMRTLNKKSLPSDLKAQLDALLPGEHLDPELLPGYASQVADILCAYAEQRALNAITTGVVPGGLWTTHTNAESYDHAVLNDVCAYSERMFALAQDDSSWTTADLSQHGREVLEGLNDFSSNLIAYVSDMGKAGDTVRSVLNLAKDVKNPKAWAAAWLSGRYGDRLAIADTKELLEAISSKISDGTPGTRVRRQVRKEGHIAQISYSRLRTSTVFAADESFNGVMTTINNLMKWDAWPTLENTWDLIPLSFVVDWFLPVQDILGQIDAAVQAPYIKVESAYVSDKLVAEVPILMPRVSGWVHVVQYDRMRHNALTDVRPFEANYSLPSFSIIHAGDALALAVQLGRRA